MSCTCSDEWKALKWTAQGPTPHARDCEDGGPRIPLWCDWNTIPENLWDGIFARVTRGIGVKRITLSFKQWERFGAMMLGCPHTAKVAYGVVTLLTSAGEIEVLPGDVPDNAPRYEP